MLTISNNFLVFHTDYKLHDLTISYLGILAINILLCFNISNVNSIINNDDHILYYRITVLYVHTQDETRSVGMDYI